MKITGLSAEEVAQRREKGQVNTSPQDLTPTYPKIFLKNILTLFNLINVALALLILFTGKFDSAYNALKEVLFLGVAVGNTFMGVLQEVRSKRTLDKISVLAQTKVNVIRGGKREAIAQDEIVLDDIVYLSAGDQICADGAVISVNMLEVDESLLTGETDRIRKRIGDKVLSGSYVTSGQAYVRATAVGDDNYANALTSAAKKKKKGKSKLLNTLNSIIRVLTIVIIPLGSLMFYVKYADGSTAAAAIKGTAASVLGMIPEGLVLLTGVTLTVGAMNLASKKALVQSLPSIETLARVDVLCLDKTGTITDGTLKLEKLEPTGSMPEAEIRKAISELMGALKDENSTAKLLRKDIGQSEGWLPEKKMPFNSDRKWSGASFSGRGTFVLGAPRLLLTTPAGNAALRAADKYAEQGYRVLCLAASKNQIEDDRLPAGIEPAALIIISDTIRSDAVETFEFFKNEGVTLKVISGDNPRTVKSVAVRAGIENADRAVDMSRLDRSVNFCELVEEYTVFGHVSPKQKKELISAMQKNGHTTCMTGDGVNDILAMREADCSVAMVGGSEAARSACDFVLMTSNFSAMTNVLREGRRVINNIDRVSSMYLVKAIYSLLLTLIFIFLQNPYPFDPLHLMPINTLTVGIPSFFLALRANYERPRGRMLSNIFEYSAPAALIVIFNTLYVQAAGYGFNINSAEMKSMVAFTIGIVSFSLLFKIARPYSRRFFALLVALVAAYMLCFFAIPDFFGYEGLVGRNAFFYLPLIAFSLFAYDYLGKKNKQFVMWRARKKREKEENA